MRSLTNGEPAGDDPWDAWTLEWATTSPPPTGNFAVLPQVHSDRPLWDMKHDKTQPRDKAQVLHAVPMVEEFSGLPIFAALTLLIVGVGLLTALPITFIGLGLLAAVAALWMSAGWPATESPAIPPERFSAIGSGVLAFIGSEVILFGALIAADIHVRVHSGTLTTRGPLHLTLPIVNTVILLSSGVVVPLRPGGLPAAQAGPLPRAPRARRSCWAPRSSAARPGSTHTSASDSRPACRARRSSRSPACTACT